MTRHIPRLSAMRREMTYDHWLHEIGNYSWKGVDVEVVAAHYNVKPSQVRETMKRIEKQHPRPKSRQRSGNAP